MDEKCELKANGLELVSLKSKAEPLCLIDQPRLHTILTENFTNQAFVVAWLDHNVMIGLWNGKGFEFYDAGNLDLKYLQRLRVFDPRQELHVWRTNGKWKARLRRDGEGENAEAIVAHQLLFGTKGERLSSRYARIREDRGTKLLLPLADVQFDEDEKGRPQRARFSSRPTTTSGTNTVHQATYFDCRFVCLHQWPKRIIIKGTGMEKAKLFVQDTKKKKIIAELQFANGKKMPVRQWNPHDTALNGSEVEVERQKGQIVPHQTG